MTRPLTMIGPHGRTGYSGVPYYLMCALQAELAHVQPVDCVDLRLDKLREAVWAVRNRSSRRFYSIRQTFLDEKLADADASGRIWLVCFQNAPSVLIRKQAEYYSYIDMTLDYYVSHYGLAISNHVKRELRDYEQRSYQAARAIFCFEESTKEELVASYDVPPDRIHVVGRGVNFDQFDAPFTIGFFGRDPARKGLYKLVAAIDQLEDETREQLRVLVIGPKRRETPRRRYIDYRGRFGAADRRALVDCLKAMDVAFLASVGDCLPGGVLEPLSLGKPVIATNGPGISQIAGHGVVIIGPEVSPAELLAAITELKNRLPRFAPTSDLSWSAVARRMLQVIGRPGRDEAARA